MTAFRERSSLIMNALDHSPRSVSPSETANSSSHSKARRLADLFRPPFDIMFRGSFEQVSVYDCAS